MRKMARVILLLALAPLIACPPPKFRGGVRDIALETVVGVSGGFPVPGVLDYGNAAGSGNGGKTAFEGVTGAFGIDDHTDAATNVQWTVTFNYSVVIFECGSGSQTGFVPLQGGIFQAVCFIQ